MKDTASELGWCSSRECNSFVKNIPPNTGLNMSGLLNSVLLVEPVQMGAVVDCRRKFLVIILTHGSVVCSS